VSLPPVEHVNSEIADALRERDWQDLTIFDRALIELDGTDNKSRLGANAVVGVSTAAARAMAAADNTPLYRWLADERQQPRIPVPHFNVINGGAHAQNPLEFQEFMIAPLGAPTFAEALRTGAEIYQTLRGLLHDRGESTGLGDEGGFAPYMAAPEQVLDLLVEAISTAGYTPGTRDVAIALDHASSEFREADGRYRYSTGELLTGEEMIDRYEVLIEHYPIWLIEDGLAEDDWEGWQQFTKGLGGRVQLVGDDNFVTKPRDHPRRDRRRCREQRGHQAQPDRNRHRDHRSHRHLPGSRLRADDLPPLRRNDRQLHRRPCRRERLRSDQVRRPCSRRAGGQVQPPAGD
jgi:enolase